MPAAVYAITSPVAGAASGPSSVTASLPTGSVAGDLCFLHFAGRGSTTGSQALTVPSGWTAIGTPEVGGFSTTIIVDAVWWKVLTAGDISTGTVTVSYGAAYTGPAYPYVGLFTVRPRTPFTGAAGQTHGTSPTPPDPAPTTSALVFSSKAVAGGAAGADTDNGFASVYAVSDGSGAPVAISVYAKEVPAGAVTMLVWSGIAATHSWAVRLTPGGWRLGKLGIGSRGGFS